MELIPVEVGQVRIRGVETGIFLAMNGKGQLYGEANPEDDSTVFIESRSGPYLMYLR